VPESSGNEVKRSGNGGKYLRRGGVEMKYMITILVILFQPIILCDTSKKY
jgi:hypothetical protein